MNHVAARRKTFNSVAQHAIATVFGGTRQQEKFTTLMEHYGDAISTVLHVTVSLFAILITKYATLYRW